MITEASLFIIVTGLFGLLVGSFLNVVIYRVPRNLSIIKPRSNCPHCKKTIPWYLNFPIFSYIFLKARSACCHKPIAKQYPLVELSSVLLTVFTAIHFGFNLQFCFALVFIWILICLFVIDLEHQLLPDSLTLGLLWIGLLANTLSLFAPLTDAVLGAIIGYLTLWLVVQIYYLITHREGMGYGDFKMLAALGAWFGWAFLPIILLTSSLLGAIIGIVYLKATKQSKHTPIPFGPFLCLAGFVILFWGGAIARYAF